MRKKIRIICIVLLQMILFLVDRPKNHLLGRWVPRSALALDEKTSDATMMRVSIRIKKQRR